MSDKITRAELAEKFPNGIPMEVVNIIFGSPDGWTVGQVREAIDAYLSPERELERLREQNAMLLSIVRRWAAIDGGRWNITRHEHERAELMRETIDAAAKFAPYEPVS